MPPPVMKTAMDSPVLSVEHVSVSYGARKAVDDLSFDIQPGEIVGLLGPNGAGKTTIIKSVCAQIEPDSGTIKIAGRLVRRGAENRKYVGLVPQDIGLYMHMSARENLTAFARMFGLRGGDITPAVMRALADVGLTQRANDLVSGLSGGMKRRINYAAAILHAPALLILDEPTAGVDIPARDALHEVTRNLAGAGYGVLLVTHELEQAEHLCDRVLVMKDGRRRDFDAPAALLHREFEGRSECLVTLDAAPDTDAVSRLQLLQFTPTDHPAIWHTEISPGAGQPLAAIVKSLDNAKISAREITLRKPGLTSLFHKMALETRS